MNCGGKHDFLGGICILCKRPQCEFDFGKHDFLGGICTLCQKTQCS